MTIDTPQPIEASELVHAASSYPNRGYCGSTQLQHVTQDWQLVTCPDCAAARLADSQPISTITNTDVYVRSADPFKMLTDEEMAKAMPPCAVTSGAGSRHWDSADTLRIDPDVLAAAIDAYEARS